MTIDERLETLTRNVDLLTADMREFYALIQRQEKRERKTRAALGAAIAAYLDALREDGDQA